MKSEKTEQVKGYEVDAVQAGLTNLSDGGMSVRFRTNEIKRGDRIAMDDMFNKSVKLIVVESDASPGDVKKIQTSEGKSYSQMVYNRLFVLYKKKQAKGEDVPANFDDYYREYQRSRLADLDSDIRLYDEF